VVQRHSHKVTWRRYRHSNSLLGVHGSPERVDPFNQFVGQVAHHPGTLKLGDAQNVTVRGGFFGKHKSPVHARQSGGRKREASLSVTSLAACEWHCSSLPVWTLYSSYDRNPKTLLKDLGCHWTGTCILGEDSTRILWRGHGAVQTRTPGKGAPVSRAILILSLHTFDASCVLRTWEALFRALGLPLHVNSLANCFGYLETRILVYRSGLSQELCQLDLQNNIKAPAILAKAFDVNPWGSTPKGIQVRAPIHIRPHFCSFSVLTMRTNGQRDEYRLQHLLPDNQLGHR